MLRYCASVSIANAIRTHPAARLWSEGADAIAGAIGVCGAFVLESVTAIGDGAGQIRALQRRGRTTPQVVRAIGDGAAIRVHTTMAAI